MFRVNVAKMGTKALPDNLKGIRGKGFALTASNLAAGIAAQAIRNMSATSEHARSMSLAQSMQGSTWDYTVN